MPSVVSSAETHGVSGADGTLPSPRATTMRWRRKRDSNPRYPFEYNGFQDRIAAEHGVASYAMLLNLQGVDGGRSASSVSVFRCGVCTLFARSPLASGPRWASKGDMTQATNRQLVAVKWPDVNRPGHRPTHSSRAKGPRVRPRSVVRKVPRPILLRGLPLSAELLGFRDLGRRHPLF